MIFANTFSASSYSKECSNAMPRSKSVWRLGLHDIGKATFPNFLSPGPQEMTGPLLRSMEAIVSVAGAVRLSVQELRKHNPENARTMPGAIGLIVTRFGEG